MNLSAQDEALWAAGLVGNAVLFAALILRQRWRGFPVFSGVGSGAYCDASDWNLGPGR